MNKEDRHFVYMLVGKELTRNDYERLMNIYNKILQTNRRIYKRIDTAIEYIERVCESENDINPYILHAPTLLEILKGSDSNE